MTLELKPLSKQTIVITGASSGIGLATAFAAARAGARVVLAARNQAALADAVQKIEAKKGNAIYVVADVTRREDLEAVSRAAIEHFGGFDTWVNDAGLGLWGKLEEVSDEDHRRLFDVNFWGVVYGSTIALKVLKQRGGALINLGSVASDMAFPIQGMYSASKHAIKGFTNALRRELEAEHAPVSVTLIKPAAIGTPFHQNAKNYTGQEPQLPPPIYAPEDVAQAILYAAQHPRRELHVGGAGKLISGAARLTPGILDRASTKLIESQVKNQPAKPRQSNLYQPGEYDGRVRGDHAPLTIRRSVYTNAAVHPALATSVAAVAGIALGWLGWRLAGR
jgi:short-subunit dehydrogenase